MLKFVLFYYIFIYSGRHGEAVGEEQGGHLHVRSEHHCRGAQVHPESNTGTMYTTTYTINTNTCTVHMADHAGDQRSVVNSGTKLCSPPVKLTQFWHTKVVLAPVLFCKNQKKKIIIMKPNSNLNHFQQLLLLTIPPPLDQYILLWY